MTVEPHLSRRAWRAAALVLFAVAWGGNAFSSLLVAYEAELGSDATWLAALFPAYAAALVPGLLLGGPVSDVLGRRTVTLVAAVLSPLASIVLMLAPLDDAVLLPGRLLAGLASGIAFAAGTAWVQELSLRSGAAPERGAARAAAALTAGFLAGPLASSLVAGWAPAPVVLAWLPHLAIALLALAAGAACAPETVPRREGTELRRSVAWRPPPAGRQFWIGAGIHAPWVFLCASTSFAVLPLLLVDVGVVRAGLVTAGTLAASLVAQALARGRTATAVLRAGLLAAATGMAVGAVAVAREDGALLLPATTLLLGAAHGWVLVSGLLATEAAADPHRRGALLATFYALTYLGFGGPSAFDAIAQLATPTTAFLLATAAATASLVASLTLRGTAAPRRHPSPRG